jgi:predicted ATPase
VLTTLAIRNYRSLLRLVLPLGRLNVITGANASGKSNLYRALRLLAETARGGVVQALAREGGLDSTLWAGPETISRGMHSGSVPVQGGPRKKSVRLHLGFASEDFGYSISLGLPVPSLSAFSKDPEIKRECIWAGPYYRPATALIDRQGSLIKSRASRSWDVITDSASTFESVFTQIADPARTPELFQMREMIRGWRFYDHFRTDHLAPARQPQLGTRTPVLHHDGHDLAAALQTIQEIGDSRALNAAIDDAFAGSSLSIGWTGDGRFSLQFHQPGLLRQLSAAELSDGTLRYVLWIAALLTPRPPSLMVLNEPETSLHPDLLPALARLIGRAADATQIWVVSHSSRLIAALNESPHCHPIELVKDLGETKVSGQRPLDEPPWHWPEK